MGRALGDGHSVMSDGSDERDRLRMPQLVQAPPQPGEQLVGDLLVRFVHERELNCRWQRFGAGVGDCRQ
jgi:hypothetical protein